MLCRDLLRSDPPFVADSEKFASGQKKANAHILQTGSEFGLTSRWTRRQRSGARQAQRIESDEMPLTMVEQVRRGGAASSTDSSRGSKVFSSARISRRAR
jgi:hypothetical protein